MTRFKMFAAVLPQELEADLNEWAASLPPGTKVRRTQLAASESGWAALVSYEPPMTVGSPGGQLDQAHLPPLTAGNR